MEQIEILKEFEKIQVLLNENNIDIKNLNESDKEIIKNYIKKNPRIENIAEQICRKIEECVNKELRLGISGKTGVGKSELLVNLFGVELPISRFGTGTTHQITKEASIAFLKLIIDDLQGLGDEQRGHETSFDHNNSYIYSQLINKDHLLIQAFDFNEIREITDEKTQLINIFRMIDFTKPEDEYLKIISKKIYIIFLRANQFSSNLEVEEKKHEINDFIQQEITEEINQKQKEKLNDLFKEINILFENQYQLQIKKIKGMINEILEKENKSLSPESRQKIIDSISFSYSGNNCRRNKQPNTIPNKNDFWLNNTNLKDYKFIPWCENWRFDIFNKIFSKVEDTQAYSLNLAIKERAKITQEKSSDSHKIKEANTEVYLKLNKEAEKSIKKGFFKHFKTAIYQICGTSIEMASHYYVYTGLFGFLGLTTLAACVPYYTGVLGVGSFFDYIDNEWGVFKDYK